MGDGPAPVKTSTSLAESVNRAATLLAADPAAARREAEVILARAPDDPRVLLILASARRRLGDTKGALGLLSPLAKAYPRAARTHYELGLVLGELSDTTGAIAALRTALNFFIQRELDSAQSRRTRLAKPESAPV